MAAGWCVFLCTSTNFLESEAVTESWSQLRFNCLFGLPNYYDTAADEEVLSNYQLVSALLLFDQSDTGKWLIAFYVPRKHEVS